MNDKADRISDEQTMVLTAGIPLAVKPDATEIAVIGIGTGLTTHTLLASPTVKRVDTIEIEKYMAEAARLFQPVNRNAFNDPRSNIVFDDAKTYFSTRNARYDIIISEPSNPWVSGVASLFTTEFYKHAKRYLKPGGVLVQWFQLYEIDISLVGSVLQALGQEFEDYAIFATVDSDLLIVAGEAETINRPLSDVFKIPGLAAELKRVNVGSVGDLAMRRLGTKKMLAPLYASFGVPPNSDFYPYLDQHAARHRFLRSSAYEMTAIGTEGVPVTAILERRDPVPAVATLTGETNYERLDLARKARFAREFLLADEPPTPRAIPSQLAKDLELIKIRGIECRDPERHDVWLNSAYQVARVVNVGLTRAEAAQVWAKVRETSCYARLPEGDRAWIDLHAAIASQDRAKMLALGSKLLAENRELNNGNKQYLLSAAVAAAITDGKLDQAGGLWEKYRDTVGRSQDNFAMRLLHGHLLAAGKVKGLMPQTE